MAKAKEVTKEIAVQVDEQASDSASKLANKTDAGLTAMTLLRQHIAKAPYDPGFMPIKVAKGSKAFTMGALGTKDSPLECIILSVNHRRGLWPPDSNITTEQLCTAFKCTPDEVDYNKQALDDWRGKRPMCGSSNTGGARGEPVKILDTSAPPIAEKFLSPPILCNYICSKCQWNEFQSDWRGGRGKACKETRMLLLYFQEEDMAATLSITPTSISAWKDYKVSLPDQNFGMCFTAISTGPTTIGDFTWNLTDFAPMKDKGKLVLVEPVHVASLGMEVSYGGRECTKYEALIAEFLNIELEEEQDYPNGEVADATPDSADDPANQEDDDTPF